MKTIKKTLLFFLLIAIPFAACEDDKTEETTVTDDKNNIQISLSALAEMVENMQNGQAMQSMDFIMDLMGYVTEIGLKDTGEPLEWYEIMWNNLEVYIDGDVVQDDFDYDHRFYYDNWLGEYTYDLSTETWSKTTSTSMIFNFPSTGTATSNDMQVTITSYTDIQITPADLKMREESDDYWYPVTFNFMIKKNGTKIIELALNNAAYDPTEAYPTLIDMRAFFSPTTLDFDFTTTIVGGMYQYAVDLAMSDNMHACGADITLTSESDIFQEYYDDGIDKDTEETPWDFLEDATISLWLNDLKVDVAIDIDALIALYTGDSVPTVAQMNSWMTAEVSYENIKIADIEFMEVEGEVELCIVYKDGSYEPVNDVIQDLMDEIGDIALNR